MGVTKITSGQITDSAIEDADGNTKVECEDSANENKIRFSTAGSERMIIDENGGVGIGLSNPSSPLYVYANISNNYVAVIDNDSGSSGHGLKVTSDGTGAGTTLLDLETGSTTVFKVRADGRVGIGVDTPGSTLSVDDEIAVGESLIHRGDPDTLLQFADNTVNLKAGNQSFIKMEKKASAPHETIFNNGGNNHDIIFKGNGSGAGNPLMKLDGSTNKVGINGIETPDKHLHVGGSMKLEGSQPTVFFADSGTEMATIGINSSNNIVIENKSMNKHIVFKCNDQGVVREGLRLDGAVPEVVINEQHGVNGDSSLIDFRVESENSTHMLFVDGGNDRVGIKTDAPVCELDVNGTVRTKAFGVNVRDVNSTSTVQDTDYCIRCIQNQAITITLPAKNTSSGRVLIFKDVLGNASTNNITIDGDSSDTIDGNATFVMDQNRQSVTLICDGINGWMIVGIT